ncbi:RNA polymerase sigma factor [Sorangium cellulosum]|uniref:RNA polymerase sigma factor n=1 Tax=Sorangium cellulosum TaxID=56 RepID=A0A2L0EHV0_SORCE|nr:sigma-70 family RNA polymerase sigma factor [Sorangium cellulosum]AUX38867.1 RNA polymerase sigma factor [Sorangium cellulosum]
MGNSSSISSSFELFRRLARRLGVPERHVEDVAQDALLRGLEVNQGIESDGDSGAYRVTVALNQARNHVRNTRRRGEVLTSFDESEVQAECPDPEELLRGRQRHALTRRLIGRLEPKHRDLLIRHDLEGIPLAHIAAELGLNTDAVKTQHRRARAQLQAEKRRWIAEQRARGRDGDACVPLAFGLHRRESWLTTLRRVVFRILVQGALAVLTGAVVSGVSPHLEAWLQAATVREPDAARTAQGATAPGREGGGSSAAEIAAPAARELAPPAPRGDAPADAAVHRTPAPSTATAPRASSPGSAERSTVSVREKSLIRDARSAMAAHNAVADLEARRLLEDHAREFPRGRLAREREEMLRQLR